MEWHIQCKYTPICRVMNKWVLNKLAMRLRMENNRRAEETIWSCANGHGHLHGLTWTLSTANTTSEIIIELMKLCVPFRIDCRSAFRVRTECMLKWMWTTCWSCVPASASQLPALLHPMAYILIRQAKAHRYFCGSHIECMTLGRDAQMQFPVFVKSPAGGDTAVAEATAQACMHSLMPMSHA